MGDGHADRLLRRRDHTARGDRAVQVERAVRPAVEIHAVRRRQHERGAVEDDAEVAEHAVAQDVVQDLAVGGGAFLRPAQRGPGGRLERVDGHVTSLAGSVACWHGPFPTESGSPLWSSSADPRPVPAARFTCSWPSSSARRSATDGSRPATSSRPPATWPRSCGVAVGGAGGVRPTARRGVDRGPDRLGHLRGGRSAAAASYCVLPRARPSLLARSCCHSAAGHPVCQPYPRSGLAASVA